MAFGEDEQILRTDILVEKDEERIKSGEVSPNMTDTAFVVHTQQPLPGADQILRAQATL
jgi:hypothetical protein